eukprot:257810-Hanusia_phi.AAC.1
MREEKMREERKRGDGGGDGDKGWSACGKNSLSGKGRHFHAVLLHGDRLRGAHGRIVHNFRRMRSDARRNVYEVYCEQ